MSKIPYTVPHFTDQETLAINDLLQNPAKILSESYTKLCRQFLKEYYQKEVLLTHSCTAALEMSALLLNIQPGDEVILPSYTFVSTANAFALFGARLVFLDMDEATFNLDVNQLEAAISAKTRAIVPMHYAAVACDMSQISAIADQQNIAIVEDAAQCIGATYRNQPLGTLGNLGCLSFHNTKNITSGLGGALIINDETLIDRAKIIWQKGTNREAFLEGMIDKYTWQDIGSSYMMNEFGSAILSAQLQRLDEITAKRMTLWQQYHHALKDVAIKYGYKRPHVPQHCQHNAHIYYLIAPDEQEAVSLRQYLASIGISAPSHYVPLHLSPAGKKFAKEVKPLPVSEDMYKRIIRLPLSENMDMTTIDYILDKLQAGIQGLKVRTPAL